ncbi:MAG: endo-1,4-beta-xylanase [Candidatus Methylacidiphilales bacterium]
MRHFYLWLVWIGLATQGALLAEPDADWRVAAAERIRSHRMTSASLQVLNPNGSPAPGVRVEFRMKRHAYPFGTAIREPVFLQSADSDPYRIHLAELFNTAVMENWMKWKQWEKPGNVDRRQSVEDIIDWLTARRFRIRGHAMVWQCPRFGVTYPKDIQRLLESTPDEAGSRVMRERILGSVREVASRHQGRLYEWDVVNEWVEWRDLTRYLTPDRDGVGSPDVPEWFHAARSADGHARLIINDYHILVGDHPKHRQRYEEMIDYLINSGAPLGGIGFQGHFYNGASRRTPAQLQEVFTRFARFGLPMVVTEFDMYGQGWGQEREEREREQAEFLEEVLTLTFSQPLSDGFLVWGFWDGAHWEKQGVFFREDWTPKPALEVWKRLLFKEWWTEKAEVVTNGSGVAEARIFSGAYEVILHHEGGTFQTLAHFIPTTAHQTVFLP